MILKLLSYNQIETAPFPEKTPEQGGFIYWTFVGQPVVCMIL